MHTAEKYWAIKPSPKTKFKYGGYYIYQQENKKMIIDSGKLSPPNLAHHEHCDALSYELAIDGQPFIVNSGTYQYEEGKWRDFFRSTSSHNTLLINNTNNSNIGKF